VLITVNWILESDLMYVLACNCEIINTKLGGLAMISVWSVDILKKSIHYIHLMQFKEPCSWTLCKLLIPASNSINRLPWWNRTIIYITDVTVKTCAFFIVLIFLFLRRNQIAQGFGNLWCWSSQAERQCCK
jgi:hypothetical protein